MTFKEFYNDYTKDIEDIETEVGDVCDIVAENNEMIDKIQNQLQDIIWEIHEINRKLKS